MHYFTGEAPEPGAEDGLRALGFTPHVLDDPLDRGRDRLRQHARLLAARYSPRLATQLRRAAQQPTAFLQVEGIPDSAYISAVPGLPTVLSTHNVDVDIARAHAVASPPRSIGRLRGNYHVYRFRRAERHACGVADLVLAASEDDAAHYRKLGEHVVLVPNGVDDMFFEAASDVPSNEDILFFGQMTYDPNLEGITRFVREGWPRLRELKPNARLLIAGLDSQELLGHLSDEDAGIVVRGLVEDIAAEIARARAVLVPLWRGSGTRFKVLEALAARRPVVGTSLGVAAIGFEHRVHGLVADTPGGLASVLAECLEDRELSERLAATGAALAERYRWRHALATVEDHYRNLVAGMA